jgi:hypothetical protein
MALVLALVLGVPITWLITQPIFTTDPADPCVFKDQATHNTQKSMKYF